MRITTAIATILLVSAGLWLRAQAPETPGKDAPVRAVGLAPRATAADYQYRVTTGMLTICGEFMGHGVPTEEGGPYNTDSYVVIEAALFGAPGAKIQLSYRDFSLRMNGKKQAEPGQPYVTVFPSLKDPEWEPTTAETAALAQTSIGGAGGSQSDRVKEAPPKLPMAR